MEKYIRVTGKGQIAVKPDLIRLNLTLEDSREKYEDTEAVKNQLLGKAVEDSKAKALVLAEAAGVTLGELVSVDYSFGEKNLVSEPMSRNMPLMKSADMVAGSYQMNIQPDDIQVSDTVTVVWQIG